MPKYDPRKEHLIYKPTPKEIESECKKFQESWSDTVRNHKLRPDWRHSTADIPMDVSMLDNR